MFLIVLRLPLCMKSRVAQAKETAQEAAFLNTIQAGDKQTMRWTVVVAIEKLLNKYPPESIVWTKTIYNAVWSGNIKLTPLNLPEALLRRHKKKRIRNNKRIYGTSFTERPEEVSAKIEEGHWEIDTVVGKSAGKESSGDTSQWVFPLTVSVKISYAQTSTNKKQPIGCVIV